MKSHEVLSLSFLLFLVLLITTACMFNPNEPAPTNTADIPREITPRVHETPWPPVVGPDPSDRVAAFYYPWYRTVEVDGYSDHWGGGIQFYPPLNIPSDYYPTLGAYSVADPAVLAQHFAWLRAAKVGVIISSWWGQASREDQAVPLLLDVAEHYGIKIAFHIEPYDGRSAARLVEDIKYLYSQYGDHPAFYRSTAPSRWSPDDRPKGLFFVWLIIKPDKLSEAVEPDYWLDAIDTIHNLPNGGLIIANTINPNWVDGGHFDGLYNYVTLHLSESGGFSWARGLPPEAWYVPSVLPGNSARRIGYPPEEFVPREDGAAFEEQWSAALDVNVEPALVTITSFNEWHEGSQIEPAAEDATNGLGFTYADYSPLPPEGYLTLTNQLATQFLRRTWPDTQLVRFQLTTTANWTNFNLISGASWFRPDLISVSDEATGARMDGDHFILDQPLTRAQAGESVEMVVDILFTDWESEDTVVFEIACGGLGWAQVVFSKHVEDDLVVVETFDHNEIGSGQEAFRFEISTEELFGVTP